MSCNAKAAAEAARDRAHKQAAAAAAAETAAKVKMKEAAEEAATMTALAQVPHYTPEQIVERANKKRATDRTRETIEMTEEDHMVRGMFLLICSLLQKHGVVCVQP